MKYTDYKVEELANDDSFINWVKSGENRVFWESLMEADPALRENIIQARLLVRALSVQPKVTVSSSDMAEVWSRISANVQESSAPRKNRKWYWAAGSVAAVFLVILGMYHYRQKDPIVSYETLISEVAPSDYKEIRNEGPDPVFINLPDRSSVVLYQGGKLGYSLSEYNSEKREVYLSGEGFFEVSKNPSKPFFVYSNELITKVLGTSFTIKAPENSDKIEVIVKSGKVEVTTQRDPNKKKILESKELEGNLLVENQKIDLKRTTMKLSPIVKGKLTELNHAVQKMKFDFEDEPLPQIIADLELAYNIKISYDSEKWQNTRLTAHLSDEPLYDKVEMICRAIEAEYEILPNQIVIK